MDLQGYTNRFVGREKELEKIEQVLTAPESAIIEVVGPPGIGKTELVNKALRDTSYSHDYQLKYYFEAGDDRRKEFTIFNLIKNLAEDLGEEVYLENGLPDYDKLLDAIRLRSGEFALVVFIDRLDVLLSRSTESNHDNKYYRYFIELLEILSNSDNTKVFLGTAYKFEPENEQLKTLSIPLYGLDVRSAIELIKTYEIHGLPYDMQWAVEDYQGHPVAIKLMCENIQHLGLNLIMDRFKFDSIFNDDIEVCRNWEERTNRRLQAIILSEDTFLLLRLLAVIDHEFDDNALQIIFDSHKILFGYFKTFDPNDNGTFHTLQNQYCLDWHTNHNSNSFSFAPLVQKLLYKTTKNQFTELWNSVNHCLYEYYRGLPKDTHPQSEEEISWLCYAAKHGCAVGKIEEVWNKLVDIRLRFNQSKDMYQAITKYKLLLPLIRLFFANNWLNIKPGFPTANKPWLINQTSILLELHSVSRREIALLDEDTVNQNSRELVGYYNLSSSYIDIGELNKAESVSQNALELCKEKLSTEEDKLFHMARSISLLTLQNRLQEASDMVSNYEAKRQEAKSNNLIDNEPTISLIRFYAFSNNSEALEICSERLGLNIKLMIQGDNLPWAFGYEVQQVICLFYLHKHSVFVEKAEQLKQSPQWILSNLSIRSEVLNLYAKALLILERDDELPAALEECYEYVAHYDLNLSLTDYHLVSAKFALIEKRTSDAQEHLTKARKIIDWSGYELVRGELNELESRAGMELSFKGQLQALDYQSLLASLFSLVSKSPKYSQLLKNLDKDSALRLLQEQVGSSHNNYLSRQQVAGYYQNTVLNADIQPSPFWLAWMQHTQQAELKKIMDSLAD